MNKPYPVLCKDCAWSRPEERSEWILRCHHPKVNANDEWALASVSSLLEGHGTVCHTERAVKWFANCGMKGKL